MRLLLNLASSLSTLDQFDEAAAVFNEAQRLLPSATPQERSQFFHVLAVNRQLLNRYGEALESIDAALREEPSSATNHWTRAELLLAQGRLPEGFAEFEWRWKHERYQGSIRPWPQPRWDGRAALEGRSKWTWSSRMHTMRAIYQELVSEKVPRPSPN